MHEMTTVDPVRSPPAEAAHAPQEAKEAKEVEDFTPPLRYPFLIGVYMATNAIPDAYTVVDGPDCLFFKTEYIHGKHDVRSTLLDVFGNHRVALTNVNAGNVAKSHGDAVLRKIKQIDALPGSSVIFVSSLPMVTIIGTQYDTLVRDAQPSTGARLIDCPGRSLQGDWLTGYSDMLVALASNIDVSGGNLDPRKIAIVGHLMDRTEADHVANVRELERIASALGLELVTVWLGNQPYAQLSEIRDAGTVLSFPLGRKAAKVIANRTGATVLDVKVPFGIPRTRRMIAELARATGTEDAANAFMEAELRELIPRMEWVVPHVFLGKKLAFSGPPDLLGGFAQIAEDLGARVVHLSAPAFGGHFTEDLSEDCDHFPTPLFSLKQRALFAEIDRLLEDGVDLVMCNTEMRTTLSRICAGRRAPASLEFGFPSFFDHALADRPFLGFRGWISFVDRMANALMATQEPTDAQSDAPATTTAL
jgi:nitrogenase molybdenum-iron protein alpha/beta subunit